jgi:UDP-N-acetylmuramoylalanine--D-glutamate ligase
MNKIALLGYGKTNKAILDNTDFDFDIFDDSFTTINKNFYPSSSYKGKIYDIAIITPGISPSNFLAKNSKNLISDFDFFKNNFPFSIWISGTNGKTTLTQMIYHLLGNKISQMGSNIGNPIALMDKNKPIWILETSSFTLHYTNEVFPNIYLLLPINDDHLSWHGSFKEYEKSKLKPLLNMNKDDIAIIPKKYSSIQTNAYTICYEDDKDLAIQLGIDIKDITIQQPFTISAILALYVQKILFDKINIDLINTFIIDKHKMQQIKDTNKRLWIDDSKATNISASKEAIKAYKDRKIYIILGGDSKNVSLEPLITFIKDFDICIYAIGSSAKEILKLAKMYNIYCDLSKDIKTAISNIDKNLQKNEVAILSPACASLDQFTSYKERGNIFQEYISKLK